ncbi:hypothetical protein LIER_30754 [Lithospermum erythrorhizon]|uniref:Gag-pol polyprotein n=1 Tax=Lithospermum erythrorhizon TaxID=34254 RepID=A0AAV3RUK6_LITER
MKGNKERGSISRPPLLDGTNYPWTPPTHVAVEGGLVVKEEADWTSAEDELALNNNKALNSIFNGIDQNVFKMISKCNVAKEA